MLYVVDLQERPRNHLDMRHRLDSQGQREGKVIDYKWEHFYIETMLILFFLLSVVRMEIFHFLWEILRWTNVVIRIGLFLSVFHFFLFCSESCLSSIKRVLSATSEKGQCRTALVSSICILGRSYVCLIPAHMARRIAAFLELCVHRRLLNCWFTHV